MKISKPSLKKIHMLVWKFFMYHPSPSPKGRGGPKKYSDDLIMPLVIYPHLDHLELHVVAIAGFCWLL
jgi:hypothetical protein